MKPKQLEALVLAAGFELQKAKGKGGHRRYLNKITGKTTEIPFHSGELRPATQKAILKDIGYREGK
ncbi:hypothetical protein FC18_GL001369 [Lacticaseibacillus sharpeae JCM 1186 = DSM 20505]|uniref:Uncharacterized protein n=2 Tax=Lacticaseibacillus sharpeae TaxID=1626 RepID=A0A0R1ZKI1_9LACO|nr:hypothetical protein FC18_GL001369 [Lacticaseibacillus sharpeae JCM 1186 = DSM 20505]